MPTARRATLASVALDPAQDTPLYLQLFEEVRDQILDGRLKPGQRLPSTRALADDLEVSRTTTLSAYEQLMSEGYIEGRTGSGAFVAAMLPEDLLLVRAPSAGKHGDTPKRAATAGAGGSSTQHRGVDVRPFDTSAQDARLFPFADWSRLLGKTWRAPKPELLHYGELFGYPPLRRAIADHLSELRGVDCAEQQVVITASAAQSIAVIARTLLGTGGTIHIEDPGYPTTYRALEDLGAVVSPVAVDAQGFVPPGVAATPTPQMAVVTPSRQYPLGMTMPLARRLELLKWAEDTGAWVIEDDYDSEYRYVGRPLSALMSLDRLEQVIYLGSFSKTMFKSLRLGFLILPRALIGPVENTLQALGARASLIAQPALGEFITSGQFAAHIRRMRRVYSERQKVLQSVLDEHFGGLLEAQKQSAGMHIPAFFTKQLSDRLTDTEAVSRLRKAGITTDALSTHYVRAPARHGLLLGFAAFEGKEIRAAANRMATALA